MKALVIMPFGGEFDDVFSGLIEPALGDLGFDVTRADLSNNQEQILKDIVVMLAEADLVIADVSGLNGNVMYELGLAHAMGKRTAMITQDIAELPFDLRSYRATAYKTSFSEAPALAKRLAEIGQSVIDGTATFGNPIQDFAPEFIGKAEQVTTVPPSVVEEASDDESDASKSDLGLLDWSVKLAESTENVKSKSEVITEATQIIGSQVTAHGEKLTRTSEQLGSKAGPTLIKLMKDTAADFDVFSTTIETTNPELAEAVRELGESTNGIARSRGATTPEEKLIMRKEIESLRTAEDSFSEAYNSVLGFAVVIEGLPKMEQTLTRATRRAARCVNETAEIIGSARSEFARARGLLEDRLGDEI